MGGCTSAPETALSAAGGPKSSVVRDEGSVAEMDPEELEKEIDKAVDFVTKIRERFSGQPEVYDEFLEVLEAYRSHGKATSEILKQVARLFAAHEDLLEEFALYLPEEEREAAKEELAQRAKDLEL